MPDKIIDGVFHGVVGISVVPVKSGKFALYEL
jgi:hypothetical protein